VRHTPLQSAENTLEKLDIRSGTQRSSKNHPASEVIFGGTFLRSSELLQNHIQGMDNARDHAQQGQYNIDPERSTDFARLHEYSEWRDEKRYDHLQNFVVHICSPD
jgi:hypothetical protein